MDTCKHNYWTACKRFFVLKYLNNLLTISERCIDILPLASFDLANTLNANFFTLYPNIFMPLVQEQEVALGDSDVLMELIAFLPVSVTRLEIHTTATVEMKSIILANGIPVPSIQGVSYIALLIFGFQCYLTRCFWCVNVRGYALTSGKHITCCNASSFNSHALQFETCRLKIVICKRYSFIREDLF